MAKDEADKILFAPVQAATPEAADTAPPPVSKVSETGVGSQLRWLRFQRFPDADVTCFRHQEQREHETYRGNDDRVEQCVAEAAGGRENRRSDERHETAA